MTKEKKEAYHHKKALNLSSFEKHKESALIDKINDRETFMKGIDHSYYYEQEE